MSGFFDRLLAHRIHRVATSSTGSTTVPSTARLRPLLSRRAPGRQVVLGLHGLFSHGDKTRYVVTGLPPVGTLR